jgi:hypothetical protein
VTTDWKRQLEEDVDLVCWWYECAPQEKDEVIAAVRGDLQNAIPVYRAMAGEVHRAIYFGTPSASD